MLPDDIKMADGDVWEYSFNYKASVTATVGLQTQTSPGGYLGNGPDLDFTTEWQLFEGTTVYAGAGAFALNFGPVAGDYYIDNLSFKRQELAPGFEEETTNGNFETNDLSGFTLGGSAAMEITTPGADGTGRAMKFSNPTQQVNAYEAQFIVILANNVKMAADDEWRYSFDYKADQPASVGLQTQTSPYGYLGNGPTLSFTTEWQRFEGTTVYPGMGALSFDIGTVPARSKKDVH